MLPLSQPRPLPDAAPAGGRRPRATAGGRGIARAPHAAIEQLRPLVEAADSALPVSFGDTPDVAAFRRQRARLTDALAISLLQLGLFAADAGAGGPPLAVAASPADQPEPQIGLVLIMPRDAADRARALTIANFVQAGMAELGLAATQEIGTVDALIADAAVHPQDLAHLAELRFLWGRRPLYAGLTEKLRALSPRTATH